MSIDTNDSNKNEIINLLKNGKHLKLSFLLQISSNILPDTQTLLPSNTLPSTRQRTLSLVYKNEILENFKEKMIQYSQPEYKPLKFWFAGTPKKSPQDIIDSYYKIDYIREGMDKLDTLSFKEAILLKDQLFDFQNYYIKNMRFMIEIGPKPLDKQIDEVNDHINKFCDKFNKELIMYKAEEVNGYKLYNVNKNIISFDFYCELIEKWLNNKEYTFSEFFEIYDETACSEWSKQDRHGKCYSGFWDYPEGTYERDNAYTLSRNDNCQGLYDLPYPKEVIIETIKMGCSNRMESVRYSNFICEWLKRKMEQINPKIYCISNKYFSDCFIKFN